MGTLLDLPVGVKAQVMSLQGGFGLQRHLASLGIMPGKIVQKITTQPMGGPIMIEVEGARISFTGLLAPLLDKGHYGSLSSHYCGSYVGYLLSLCHYFCCFSKRTRGERYPEEYGFNASCGSGSGRITSSYFWPD